MDKFNTIADITRYLIDYWHISDSEYHNVFTRIKRQVQNTPGHESWKSGTGKNTEWRIPKAEAEAIIRSRAIEKYVRKKILDTRDKSHEYRQAKAAIEAENEERLIAYEEQLHDLAPYLQEYEEREERGADIPSPLERDVYYIKKLLEGMVSYIGFSNGEGKFDFQTYRSLCRELQDLEARRDWLIQTNRETPPEEISERMTIVKTQLEPLRKHYKTATPIDGL